ncbi:MAG: peptidylprolyl isomerase [Rubrivivax sp.]|nr:peptidylprolyl isomerase [Rubrivivax sp.]
MSAQLPIEPLDGLGQHRSGRRGWPAWLREPLLHFALLGGLLFGVDHVLLGRADDPNTIVMGTDVDREARQTFKATRGRDPNAEELAALRQIWLDNEVLYRQGLALQVDKGDTAIRERVIFKALSVVDSNVRRPPIEEPVLRAWFEKNRVRYDEPMRYDFQEAVLAGESDENAVRAFVAALNTGTPGDAKAGLRAFKGRPHGNLVQSYGEEFAKGLEGATPGEWRALSTREGWRAMRLDAVIAARPASFEALRSVVLQDWTDAVMAEQRTAAVRALAGKYRIRPGAAS